MKIQAFMQRYGDEETLHSISWGDFPEEFRKACLKFIDEWRENIPVDGLRDLSGFNEMSVDELLMYVKSELPEEIRPFGAPYHVNLF